MRYPFIKHNITLLLIILGCVFVSCNSKNTDRSLPTINLKENISKFSHVPLSKMAKEINYIPLETNKECMLGNINHIFRINDTLIIAGYDFCKTFDKNGKFIGNIGKIGKGPGEYQYVSELSVDRDVNIIYVYCQEKIEAYSLNGTHLQTIHIPIEDAIRSFYVKRNIFCSINSIQRGNEKNRVVFFNDINKVINTFPNSQPFLRTENFINSLDQGNFYIGQNNRFLYKDGINDTIYKLENNLELSPYYILDMGKYRMPMEIIKGTRKNYSASSGNYIFVKSILETNSALFLSFHFNKHLKENDSKAEQATVFGKYVEYKPTLVATVFDKSNSKLTLLKGSYGMIGLQNDLDGGLPFWPVAVGGKDELICWYSAEEMLELLSDSHFQKSKAQNSPANEKLKVLVRNIRDTDNPIIAVVTLK